MIEVVGFARLRVYLILLSVECRSNADIRSALSAAQSRWSGLHHLHFASQVQRSFPIQDSLADGVDIATIRIVSNHARVVRFGHARWLLLADLVIRKRCLAPVSKLLRLQLLIIVLLADSIKLTDNQLLAAPGRVCRLLLVLLFLQSVDVPLTHALTESILARKKLRITVARRPRCLLLFVAFVDGSLRPEH